jgi:hypothetical protein
MIGRAYRSPFGKWFYEETLFKDGRQYVAFRSHSHGGPRRRLTNAERRSRMRSLRIPGAAMIAIK